MGTSLLRNRRGAAAIEFAFLVIPVVVITTGVLDYGWFFYQQSAMMDAGRAAVRVASMTATENDPEGVAKAELEDLLDGMAISTTELEIEFGMTASGDANVITLTASVPYEPLLGLLPPPDFLNARVSMVHEFPP